MIKRKENAKRWLIISFFILSIVGLRVIWAFYQLRKGPFAITDDRIKIKVDYVAQYNELTKPANYDPNNNAAIFYKKAFEVLVEIPKNEEGYTKMLPIDINDAELDSLKTWLALNSQANSYLRQAAQKPYYWVERDAEDGFLMSIEISDLEHFRTGADSLSLEAMLLAREWQTETSLEQLINLYKIASHLLGSRSLIEQLVGFRIEGQANQIIRNILHRSQPDPELLFDFQKQLEILVARDRTVDFTSEKLVIYDCIQRIFTDDDNGNGHMPKKMAKKHGVPWVKADRQETFKLTDRLYEYYNRLGEKTPAQLHRENKDTPESLEELANGNSLLLMLRPAMFKIYQISYRTEMEIRASITIIALLRYKANNGKYPSTLKKLVSAGYLNELPMDPFSDSPLVYKCQEDDFILYSFGYDFNDDGGIDSKWGTSEQGGDQVFWPIK